MSSKTKATNGHTNGHTNGQAKAQTTSTASQNGWRKYTPNKHGYEEVSWFWPLLSLACMIFVPLGIYWCWVCVRYYEGKMYLPKDMSSDAFKIWFDDIWAKVVDPVDGAIPTSKTWTIYLLWNVLQALLFHFAPGPVGDGALLPDGKSRLKYKYNGQFAWFFTLALATVLHITDYFPITTLHDEFARLLTVTVIFTSVVVGLIYIYARIFNCGFRMTDSIIYDYFMGAILNPRIGTFDIKFFFELRPGIMHWFFTTVAFALKQYHNHGYVTGPMVLIVFYHLCFVNACYKGEQCVPQSMDIIYEKFGWMLCMLDLVMVPIVFPLQAYYLLYIAPFEHSWPITLLLLFTHCFAYWMFDTSNSQKDYFRHKPGEGIHTGFPHLPWGKLENPKYLQTKRGTKLLLGGWWGWARHLNYTGDIIMSWTWGLTCGVSSYFPFAYTTYLTPLLLHRERRDDRDCATKYGKDWDEYKKLVPYRLIPYIY